MKIVLLTNGIYPYSIGGIQKHSYFLAKYFAKNKIVVTIYHPGKANEDGFKIKNYFDSEELQFINFIVVPFPKVAQLPGHYIYASYVYSKELYKRINKLDEPYFVYAQGFTSWYFLKKEAFQKNLISNLHGLNMFQYICGIKSKVGKCLLRIPASFIVSKSYRQISLGGKLTDILYHNGAEINSVIEIPNGVASDWILSEESVKSQAKNKRLKLVFIGRYERLKGIKEFQKVIKNSIDILHYEVDFIGPIPEEKQLKHFNVNYLGTIMESEKIKAVLMKSDILVCPSYSEGMPTVILEAMACGCAIIATNVGATNTIVNRENGWLLEGDIVPSLNRAILEAANCTHEELNLKKQHSINKVRENFTWEQVIEKTITEIEAVYK
jgi:glycosyltransferase involved in cell wall biosynthesis